MPSGWLTLLCLFLPSFRWCAGDDPRPLAVVVPIWPLLLGGVVIALAAGAASEHARRTRGRRLLKFVQLSVLCPAMLIGYQFVVRGSFHSFVQAGVAGVVTFVVFWATRRDPSELAVAAVASCVAASHAVICVLLPALGPSAVWGATTSFVVACVLLAGTLWWTAEAAYARSAKRAIVTR